MTKEDIKNIKKTTEAYGEISDVVSKEMEENPEKTSMKTIEKEIEREIKEEKEETEEIIKSLEEIREEKRIANDKEKIEAWEPKTKLGKEVKDGFIKNINEILDTNKKILEEEIVDKLLGVKSDLISIGQSKGKFGGGKRRAWRQTQRKKKEGSVPSFSTLAVIGDENGHIGIGMGKATETLPARDKAIRAAKLNVMKITRGCSAFDCTCGNNHSVPFEVEGKMGSVRVKLIPAPQGTGLVVGNELKKVLKLAGIKDVYSRATGQKRTSFNLVKACIEALKKTNNLIGGKIE